MNEPGMFVIGDSTSETVTVSPLVPCTIHQFEAIKRYYNTSTATEALERRSVSGPKYVFTDCHFAVDCLHPPADRIVKT